MAQSLYGRGYDEVLWSFSANNAVSTFESKPRAFQGTEKFQGRYGPQDLQSGFGTSTLYPSINDNSVRVGDFLAESDVTFGDTSMYSRSQNEFGDFRAASMYGRSHNEVLWAYSANNAVSIDRSREKPFPGTPEGHRRLVCLDALSTAYESAHDGTISVSDEPVAPDASELPIPLFRSTVDDTSVPSLDDANHADSEPESGANGIDLIITNIPVHYIQDMVAQEMYYGEEAVFTVPMRRDNRTNLGFGFVRLPTLEHAMGFLERWKGDRLSRFPGARARTRPFQVKFCHGSLQ